MKKILLSVVLFLGCVNSVLASSFAYTWNGEWQFYDKSNVLVESGVVDGTFDFGNTAGAFAEGTLTQGSNVSSALVGGAWTVNDMIIALEGDWIVSGPGIDKRFTVAPGEMRVDFNWNNLLGGDSLNVVNEYRWYGYNGTNQAPFDTPDNLAIATNMDMDMDGITGTMINSGRYQGLSVVFVMGNVEHVAAVPLPPALWLFGVGLMGLLTMSKRKK